ncbi:hypothetical protein ALC56_03480 [Trachymyrmex septentrionalis]|uniref:Uncharacterized protein n=1 Tax=Trachymyrmex septentrionalis TaxID=34720 RepID=A0A195FPX6_9HYME|nr:hypothetical protein ALC56_03480 [Trachymyrmex septentrionalis]
MQTGVCVATSMIALEFLDKPLQGTKVTVSLKPACFRNTLILSTISLNLSLDQFTVSSLLTTTASCDTPKFLIKIQNCKYRKLMLNIVFFNN